MLRLSPSQPNVFRRFGLMHALTAAVVGGSTIIIALRLLAATGSATAFGVAMGIALVPVGLTTPLVGRWVDRVEPRRFLHASAWLTAGGVTALGVGMLQDRLPIPAAVLILMLLHGALGAQTIAGGPFVRRWIASNRLSRANALVHVFGDSARLAGAAIGSFAFGGGWSIAFCVMGTAVLLVSARVIQRARCPGLPLETVSSPARFADAPPSTRGLGLLRSAPLLGLLTGLFVLRRAANSGFDVLAPPIVLAFGSPNLVGIVMSACSVGYLVIGVWLSLIEIRRPLRWVVIAATCSSTALIGFGLFGTPAVFIGLAFVIYGAEMVIITANELYWQRVVDPRILGRTVALRALVAGAGALAASLAAGPVASTIGETWNLSLPAAGQIVLVLFGSALLVCALGLMLRVARRPPTFPIRTSTPPRNDPPS